jgi:hypothetical protein
MVHTKSTRHHRRYLIPSHCFVVKKRGAHHFCGRSFSWSNLLQAAPKNVCTHLPVLTCHDVMCTMLRRFVRGTFFFFFAVALVFLRSSPAHHEGGSANEVCSDSIHVLTMVLNWSNTSFWLAYGVARKNPIILIPNAIRILLGLSCKDSCALCLLYPRSGLHVPVQQEGSDEEELSQNLLIV